MCKLSLSGRPLVTPASTFHRLRGAQTCHKSLKPALETGEADRWRSAGPAGIACRALLCRRHVWVWVWGAPGSRLKAKAKHRSPCEVRKSLALLWEGTINGWFSCHLVTNPHLKNCPDGFDVVRPTLMAGGTFRQQSDKEPLSGERSPRPLLPMWLCSEQLCPPWVTRELEFLSLHHAIGTSRLQKPSRLPGARLALRMHAALWTR